MIKLTGSNNAVVYVHRSHIAALEESGQYTLVYLAGIDTPLRIVGKPAEIINLIGLND